MSAEDEILDELVFQVLERRESGDARALEEICAAHPERAEELRRRVSTLEASGMMPGQRDVPETLGEFRIVRRLGQGGMGVVFLAEQPQLHRRVAIKMVRPEQLYFRGARERFQREVEAIARLSHPAIVPVFTVGEAAGVPFYAMELVEGASLAEVLTRLHGKDPARLTGADLHASIVALCRERGFDPGPGTPSDPLFASSWPDACAWLVREIAQALEHAHQRGVLHRDVKPSNILLAPSGRVLLTDFGLASTREGERITKSGSQLGSLPYMPPEQIAGRLDALGPRSDVFSLGATFYEALTLELPFESRASTESLTGLAARRPVPPRRRNASLAADFELVCATALEGDAERRYASAAHFARDLSNLLQRRSIEARPPGAWITLRRWTQRNPAGATAVAIGIVAALVLPTAFALQESRARERIASERDIARTNLDSALDAIELMLEKVAHRDLRDVPRIDAVKRELLQRATVLYEKLESSSTGDFRAQLRSASALGKLARLRRDTGDPQGAERDFAEAERRLRALNDSHPDDAGVLLELGNLTAFATLARYPSSSPAAIEAMQFGVATLRRAAEIDASSLKARHELVRGLLGLAHLQDTGDRREEAVASWTEARRIASELLERNLESNDALELWVTSQGRLGNVAFVRGQHDDAERMFEEVLERSKDVAQPSAYMRQMRASTMQMLERIRIGRESSERDPRNDELLEGAHVEFEALVRDYPRNDSYLSSRAMSWMDRGDRERKFGDLDEARACFDESRRDFSELVMRVPADARFPRSLGLLAHREADLAREAGRYADAEPLLEAALVRYREAWSIVRREVYREDLLLALRSLVEVGAETGHDQVVARAAEGLRELSKDPFEAGFDAAQAYRVAYELAHDAGALERSSEWLEKAREQLEAALAADPARGAKIADAIDAWKIADPALSELQARARAPR